MQIFFMTPYHSSIIYEQELVNQLFVWQSCWESVSNSYSDLEK